MCHWLLGGVCGQGDRSAVLRDDYTGARAAACRVCRGKRAGSPHAWWGGGAGGNSNSGNTYGGGGGGSGYYDTNLVSGGSTVQASGSGWETNRPSGIAGRASYGNNNRGGHGYIILSY